MTDRAQGHRLLPHGWRWVRLGEAIREAQLGFACGERDPNGTVQLRMNNVTDRGGFDWSTITRVPVDSEMIQMYRLELGDVLFNNTNSTDLVGKTAIFEGFDEPVVFSNHFTRLRTLDDLLSPSFLALWLRKQWQNRLFANICNRWIGQSAVQRDKLLALEVPLPPLPEQQRIAALLNEQMAAVERARAAAEARLEAARALPAAYLRAVFNSSEAENWPRMRLGAICEIQLGKMLSPKSKTGRRSRPYLRNVNVQWNRFDLSEVIEMDFTEEEEEKFALRSGDLLVCEGGEPGRAAVWSGEMVPCCYQKALHRLRPIDGCADPHFLMYRLWFGAVTGEFVHSQAKTTIAHLPGVRLASLLVGLPSTMEQRHIAAILTDRMATVERMRLALEEEFKVINALPAALLRLAFNGEL